MAVMIMEALEGFEHKYSWSLVGHSGDGPAVPLVDYAHPPADRAQRLKVVQVMARSERQREREIEREKERERADAMKLVHHPRSRR
jgi:hypothetical protein